MEVTKEQIQAWVREEQEKIDKEKQEACDHKVSGTLNNGVLTCDTCNKVLIFDPNADNKGAELGKHEKAHFEALRKDK